MSDLDWTGVALLGLVATWLYMHRWYRRIWGASAKWWAIPFCHGAVMFAKRLPASWEKGKRHKRGCCLSADHINQCWTGDEIEAVQSSAGAAYLDSLRRLGRPDLADALEAQAAWADRHRSESLTDQEATG